ncbi:glycosyl transferase [Clostridium acetobutylicum]|nr:glycosyl transferase [Clostridium acetobutylicum]
MTIDKLKLNTINLRNTFSNRSKPPISIITSTNKPKYFRNTIKNYTRLNYRYKELILIFNIDNIDIDYYKSYAEKIPNVMVFQLNECYSLGYCLNFGVNQSKYNYIAKMDDDDYYGPNYLTDEINAFNYTDAKIIGKCKYFTYFEDTRDLSINNYSQSYDYTNFIAGGTFLIKKELFKTYKFRDVNMGEDAGFLDDCSSHGIKIYSIDPFNYVYIRHKSLDEHTWKIPTTALKKQYFHFYKTTNYIPIVKI